MIVSRTPLDITLLLINYIRRYKTDPAGVIPFSTSTLEPPVPASQSVMTVEPEPGDDE